MKNRLNNKGFAVSTVVYAILILLVILMFTILLLYRNTYRNQKQFSVDVQDELNDYLIESNTIPECIIEMENESISSKKLTIKIITTNDENIKYVIKDNTTVPLASDFSDNNIMVVSNSGNYYAFVKDEYGNNGKCEINVDLEKPTCSLSLDGNNIKIVANDNDSLAEQPYSTDNINYTSNSTISVDVSGSYKAYVKDKSDNVGECTAKLYTATFSLENTYSSSITSPTSTISRSCLTESSSCNITTPSLIVSSGYNAKGWSTTKNSSSATASSNSTISISNNVTYYPVITKTGGSISYICEPDNYISSECNACTKTIRKKYCNSNGTGFSVDDTGIACTPPANSVCIN